MPPEYKPRSMNAMFAELLTRLVAVERQLQEIQSWQSSFGIRMEKRLNDVETVQRVNKGQVVVAVSIMSAVAGGVAFLINLFFGVGHK